MKLSKIFFVFFILLNVIILTYTITIEELTLQNNNKDNVDLKITTHISFFYLEKRIEYINKIIEEINKYRYKTDIFIHTNKNDLTVDTFKPYTNGGITIVFHDLTNINPFLLTWKCRDLAYKQRDDYDIFIYIEDDIVVPNKAIEYWLQYNEKLIEMDYNLGFIRIEVDKNGTEYIADLYNETLDKIMTIDGEQYCVNDKNPYCAFWIYNKNEFNRFVNSEYYDPKNIPKYDIREKSAIGLHGKTNYWYKNTLIPMVGNKLHDDCKIYHIANTYLSHGYFSTIKFDEPINITPINITPYVKNPSTTMKSIST